jgi:predicted methyltransferase
VLLAACGGMSRSRPAADDARPAVRAAMAGAHRTPENRARDAARHPEETLAFFGLRDDMTVVELWPGGGWYTDILAPVLRERGKLVAATPDANGANEYRARGARAFRDRLAAQPAVFDRVALAMLDRGRIDLGPPGTADLVVTFRNTHNWINDGIEADVYAAAYRVLRPGGVLGVVQHRAPAGAEAKTSAKAGYVPEAHVIRLAEAAGFRLDGRSEVNANPRDTKDHPDGVWSLPPVLRGGEKDRARFVAIGESDRMTLRFVK